MQVKGADEEGFAVKAIVDDVKWLGYSKIVLKTDNEPAILKLLQESLRDLRVEGLDQVMAENSPEYDPQSNGSAEVGVKLVEGMVRTMRSGLERELRFRVPARHPLVSWIVRHAANTLTWAVKGHDGMSAYQWVRGKPFRTRLLTFGEQCRYKVRSHEPLSPSGDGKRFHLGTYVGIDRRTGQYMIHYGDGIATQELSFEFRRGTSGTRMSWPRSRRRRGRSTNLVTWRWSSRRGRRLRIWS